MNLESKIFIGIDVSKATLDLCIRIGQKNNYEIIQNNTSSIHKFMKKFKDPLSVTIGMENTGRYNWSLYEALNGSKFTVFVISPLHLKKSLGLVRGKSDKVDSYRITTFIEKYSNELTPWLAPRKQIQKLKVLLTERNYRIKTKRQLLSMQHDYKLMKGLEMDKVLKKMNNKLIAEIQKQVVDLEKQIEEIIIFDENLCHQAKLMRSVPGVGKVLSWYMLAKTNEFKSITDPRKMACYSGVVPFDYQSGTSILRKKRVSVFADKTIKSLLHLGAMSSIRLNNDLKVYYDRKVNEGKNKMSVLNAVRNKIIHRIFSVIKNQKMYQNNLVLS